MRLINADSGFQYARKTRSQGQKKFVKEHVGRSKEHIGRSLITFQRNDIADGNDDINDGLN